MTDPRLLEGIRHFNAEAFFDAHETLEALWHDTDVEPDRSIVQALIQIAVAFYHVRRGNWHGALSLRTKALGRLAALGISHGCGLDLDGLARDVTAALAPIAAAPESERFGMVPARYPKLTLSEDRDSLAGDH